MHISTLFECKKSSILPKISQFVLLFQFAFSNLFFSVPNVTPVIGNRVMGNRVDGKSLVTIAIPWAEI